MIIHVMFTGILILEKDAPSWLQWLFELNYLKHATDGIVHAIFGYNREKLECDEIYCHFQDPKVFLRMIGASHNPLKFLYIFPFIFLMLHTLAFINMRNRLKRAT